MKPIVITKAIKATIRYELTLTEELFNKLVEAYDITADEEHPMVTFEQFNELILNGQYKFFDKYKYYPYVHYKVWDGSYSHFGTDYYTGEMWQCDHTPGWGLGWAEIDVAIRAIISEDYETYRHTDCTRPKGPIIINWDESESINRFEDDKDNYLDIDIPTKVKIEYYE